MINTPPPRLFSACLLAVLLLFPAISLLANESPPAETSPAVVEQNVSALDLYRQGGPLMHVLLVCSVAASVVVLYGFLQITAKKMAPQELADRVNGFLAVRDVGSAYQICESHPSVYGRVMKGALLKVNFGRDLANKASMSDAAAELLDQEEHRQMVWVNYLNVVATLAPMIGLLGTVFGMIESFDKLATTSGDAKNLAGGIKVAMVTTAAGLIVGIPAMFFYFFFRDKLLGVMSAIQHQASFAIDILSGEIRLQGQEPAEDVERHREEPGPEPNTTQPQ